jgi:hypothetical protein
MLEKTEIWKAYKGGKTKPHNALLGQVVQRKQVFTGKYIEDIYTFFIWHLGKIATQ